MEEVCRIAVCDDEEAQLDKMRELLAVYGQRHPEYSFRTDFFRDARDCMRRVQTSKSSFYLGPWRLMELDSLVYRTEIEEIQERNRAMGAKYGAEDDFKYAYRKKDSLAPVLNLTLYWGRKRREHPLSLRDMAEMDSLPGKLKDLFEDHRVHLIYMRRIPEEALDKMDSVLKYVLGIMKHTGSRKKYERYVLENREYFSRVPKGAVDVIDACTGIKDITDCLEYTLNKETGEEEADVCKALNDIKKNAEKKGMKQGVKQGEKHLGVLMQKLLADGRTEDARLAATDEEERGRLYRECGIAVK